ncbi:DUF6801 domain-containing protein [Actinocrispum wychmicini]|uniref:DUF6801 domain-containing protein n=1 Tax=Actinocrispum wychmicini TaxID=1213861 RepID=A0A4R2IR82_9PSEU|nr:DUF6801 domain-containing protein [Actinocrispum wychmicini]TCO46508.1 hypothetical protein EV192_11987 [Actinocrispum wychmicini]
MTSGRSRPVWRRLAAGVLAVCALVGGAVPASAGVVTRSFTYRCAWPFVGAQDVQMTYSVDIPGSGAPGSRIAVGDLHITGILAANVVSFLRASQIASVSGPVVADLDIAHNGTTRTLGVPGLALAKRTIPLSGPSTLDISGPVPSLVVYSPGDVLVRTGQFIIKMDTRKADGTPTALGVVNVPCSPKATTPPQDLTLATLPVNGPGTSPPGLGNQVPGGSFSKALTYHCVLPQTGSLGVSATLAGTVPSSGATGTRLQPNLTASMAVPSQFADVLRNNSAASVSGNGRTDIVSAYNGETLTLGVPGPVPAVAVPVSGPLTVALSPAVPSFSVPAAGSIALAAGPEISGTFTPLKADGSPTALGTFDVPCTLDAGQDPALGTITIT